MNRIESPFKPLLWLVAMLMSVFVAACGGGGGGGSTTAAPPAPANVLPGAAGSPGAAATNPTVISSSPTSGATAVSTSTQSGPPPVTSVKVLTATFNAAMDPTTITPVGVFTLKTAAGVNVPGVVTMNGPTNTIATFTPSVANLSAATTYTATISTAAKNPGGTAMPNPIVWSFTTAAVLTTGRAPVNLLTAANFTLLAKTTITDVPASAIVGNIAVSPGTGFAIKVTCAEMTSGQIYQVDAAYVLADQSCVAAPGVATKAAADQAIADMGTAYADAAARTLPDATELGAGNISGLVIDPGLYKWSTDVNINTDVTLHGRGDANAVWIFQITGDLNVAAAGSLAAGVHVTLAGGAKSANIFWQVAGPIGATLGTFATFNGNILSAKQAVANTGAVVNGRLMADTQVTLQQNPVTQPTP